MTERTIRSMAKELAGTFYDVVRSAESADEKVQITKRGRIFLQIDPKLFAKTFPTVKDYLAGRRHGRIERLLDGTVRHIDDGSVAMDTPGWMHWYDRGRQMLIAMLNNPGTHENIKDGILAALVEDREKQLKQFDPRLSPNIAQRHRMGVRE